MISLRIFCFIPSLRIPVPLSLLPPFFLLGVEYNFLCSLLLFFLDNCTSGITEHLVPSPSSYPRSIISRPGLAGRIPSFLLLLLSQSNCFLLYIPKVLEQYLSNSIVFFVEAKILKVVLFARCLVHCRRYTSISCL